MNKCCINCFYDKYLKNFIEESGQIGDCDYCGSINIACIDINKIALILEPLLSLYSPIEEFVSSEEMKNGQYMENGYFHEFTFLWEELLYNWELFDDPLIDANKVETLIEDIVWELGLNEQILQSFVMVESDYYGEGKFTSEIMRDYWDEFCNDIKFDNRFFVSAEIQKELLNPLHQIFPYITIYPESKEIFYRARIQRDKDKIKIEDMGIPQIEYRRPGRANPFPIGYLYLASNELTAITEVRPDISEIVTVGKFILNKSLPILDISHIKPPFDWGWDIRIYYKYVRFLLFLGNELSKPLAPYQEAIEYIPTQFLCGFIKSEGIKGIKYRSHRGPGNNYVFFSEESFKYNELKTYKIESIEYKFSEQK